MVCQQSRIVWMIKKQCKNKLTGGEVFYLSRLFFSIFSYQDNFSTSEKNFQD